jgi:putative endonuclease
MTFTPRRLGAEGEQLATEYLQRRGYKIIGRNLKIGGVEIDIVAEQLGVTILVEVKTRSTESFGAPELAVTDFKLQRLSRAAAAYYLTKKPVVIRLDVISILRAGTNSGQTRIRHYKAVGETADLASFA